MQEIKSAVDSKETDNANTNSQHYLSDPMQYNPVQTSKQDLDNYILRAEKHTDQLLMKITNTQTVEQATDLLKKNSRPGGSCSGKIKDSDISWRCFTCSINQNTIICNECMKNGNHEGHKLSSLTSMGGRCDCGDKSSLVKEGYCSLHTGQDIDEFDLMEFDQNIRNIAQEEIEKAIRALDHLSLQIQKIPLFVQQILKHAIFLTRIGSLNTYAVKMIVVALCKKSQSKYYKHFENIFGQKKCNTWVSQELIKFDKWFQFIEKKGNQQKQQCKQDDDNDDDKKEEAVCQCLRFDNILRSMLRLTIKQKQFLNDFYFIMCKSYKFREMGSIVLVSNFHYLGIKSLEEMYYSDQHFRFDVFLNLGYQLFPQIEAINLILRSQVGQNCIALGFKAAILAYKDQSNIFGRMFVEKVLAYFSQILQALSDKNGDEVFKFYEKLLPCLCQLDFFFLNK